MTQPPVGGYQARPGSTAPPPYSESTEGQPGYRGGSDAHRPAHSRVSSRGDVKPTISESVQHNLPQSQTEGVSPDLIASIAKEVLKELEQRKQHDPTTYIPAHFYPQRPEAPLSPTASSIHSPEPMPLREVHTPPSPQKQSEFTNDSPIHRASYHQPYVERASSQSPTSERSSPQSRRASLHEPAQRQERPSTSEEETPWEKIWGKFFEDGKPTAKLSELLRGMAHHMIESYEPKNSLVVTPDKMQRYYRDTHITNEPYPWDVIFDDSISCIGRMYRELGCEHHLVQEAGEVHEKPDIPGLTPNGFRHWATIMVLAHPDAAHERLQRIVREFPISNPDDRSQRFPKELPRTLFPKEPNMQIRRILVDAIEEHARVSIHAADSDDIPRKFGSTQSSSTSTLPRPIPMPPPPPAAASEPRPPSRSQQSEASFTSETSNIERERKPYAASMPPSCAIDDINPTPSTARPIERERKPYTAKGGEGRNFDLRASDEDLAPRSPISNNVSSAFPPMPEMRSPVPPVSASVPPPQTRPAATSQPPPPMPSIQRTYSNSNGPRPINIPSHGPPRARGEHAPPPLASSATFSVPGPRSSGPPMGSHAHRSSVSRSQRAYSPPPGAQFRASEGDVGGGPSGGMSASYDASNRSSWDGRDERRFEYRPAEDTLPPPGPPPANRRRNSPRRPSNYNGPEEEFYQMRPRRETTGMRPNW